MRIRIWKYFKGFFNSTWYGIFHNYLAHISEKTELIFTKILSQVYPWKRKRPLSLGSLPHPDSRAGYGLRIQTGFALAEIFSLSLLKSVRPTWKSLAGDDQSRSPLLYIAITSRLCRRCNSSPPNVRWILGRMNSMIGLLPEHLPDRSWTVIPS